MTPTNGKHFTKTEVIDTPLLKVPPAARGEPCRGAVPPRCARGTVQGGGSPCVQGEL
jgi:hypothetical protein